MARASVKVEGLSELGKNLALFSKDVKKNVLKKAAREAAYEIRDAAKQIITSKRLIKSGAMRDAVAARRLPKASTEGREFYSVGVFKLKKKYSKTRANVRKQRVGKEYDVDPPEFYWKFVELGTVKMKAKPFLVPAFNSRKQSSPDTMKKVIADGIEKATRKLSKSKKGK